MMIVHTHTKSSKGFTLIELLVVMGIIGILATLMFTNFASARSRARDVKRKNDLNQVKNALRLYYNDYQKYPDDNSDSGSIYGCSATHVALCTWGSSAFTDGTTVYLNQLPQDPIYDPAAPGSPQYSYQMGSLLNATDNSFTLSATLENKSDTSIPESQRRCGVATPDDHTYMVCAD